jgi:hypothetical protein
MSMGFSFLPSYLSPSLPSFFFSFFLLFIVSAGIFVVVLIYEFPFVILALCPMAASA